MKKNYVFTSILIGLLVLVIEGICFLAGVVILKVSSGGILYSPNQVSSKEYFETIKPKFNYSLGWPEDKNGIKETFFFESNNPDQKHISIYGDSFVKSPTNKLPNKWTRKLADKTDLNVHNYGVSAYGTDQAYLRYLYNSNDTCEIVVLNHFVGDLTRNLMQKFFYEYTNFKPMLVLENDSLICIPPIVLKSQDEFDNYVNNPTSRITKDWLAPENEYGPTMFEFPYSIALFKALLSKNILDKIFNNNIEGEVAYRRFYKQKYPVDLTSKIINEFINEAKKRGQTPIITIMPAIGDFEYFQKYGRWEHDVLIENIIDTNVLVLDFSPELYKRHDPKNKYRDLYDETFHFNPIGEELCANVFKDFLVKNEIID